LKLFPIALGGMFWGVLMVKSRHFTTVQIMSLHLERSPARTAARGFTLIELMIAVVIVGILLSVALPAYKQHGISGRRAAAQAEMLTIANREQQELLANRSYASKTTLESNGYTLPSSVSTFYTYTIDVTASPPAFTITFTPVSGGVQASDGALTLTQSGVKGPSGKW
jgi:type IV pilus assembly protein PilE